MGPAPEETREGGPTKPSDKMETKSPEQPKSTDHPSSQLMMTSGHNLDKHLYTAKTIADKADKYIDDIELALQELYKIGESTTDLGEMLGKVVNGFKESLSTQRQKGEHEAIKKFRASLDKMLETVKDYYKDLVRNIYDTKSLTYKIALAIIETYTRKYDVSDKQKLLELLEKTNASQEVLSAVKQALNLGRDLEEVRNNLSSIVATIEEEKKKALAEIDKVYSGLQEYITEFTNKIMSGFIEMYKSIVTKVEDQFKSGIGGCVNKVVGYAKRVVESLKKIGDVLAKEKERLDEESKVHEEIENILAKQGIFSYKGKREEIEKEKSKIEIIMDKVNTAKNMLEERINSIRSII